MQRSPAALFVRPWSVQAFDRILLILVLTAPQVVMLAWLVTNDVGVAERALWLEPSPPATRLMGTGVWAVVVAATVLAVTKGGKFIWLWLIAVAAPLYWTAFVPSAGAIVAVTPFLPLAGLFGSVALFCIADWFCALVLLLLQLVLHQIAPRIDLIEGDLNQFSGRGRLHRALTTDGAGFGVFVAIVTWSLSIAAPNVLPGGLLSVLGVIFAALLALSLLRRVRLAPLLFAFLSFVPYVAVLIAGRFGFWPAAPQPVFVHMVLMILIATPFVWLGYGISALVAGEPRSWFTLLLCAAAALVIGVAIQLMSAMFVYVFPGLVGVSVPAPRLETAREIWLESQWSWAVVAVAALVVFVGYWSPSQLNARGAPAATAGL